MTKLPTWATLVRARSKAKNKEPMPADDTQDLSDTDEAPRKKLRTALFKESAEKEN